MTKEVRVWRRIISSSRTRQRMSSAWEIKEHKCYEGIKTFPFLRGILGDTTQNTRFASFIGAVLLLKPGGVPGLCTELSHRVSKAEPSSFRDHGLPFQRCCIPSSLAPSSFPQPNPIHPRYFLLLLHLNGVELHTDLPTILCAIFIAMAQLFPEPENTWVSTVSAR